MKDLKKMQDAVDMTSMAEKPIDGKAKNKLVSDAVDVDASALEFEKLNKESKRKMAEFQKENMKSFAELSDKMNEMTKKISKRQKAKPTNADLKTNLDALERLTSSLSSSSP